MNAKIRNAIKLPVTNPVPSPLTSSDISDLRRVQKTKEECVSFAQRGPAKFSCVDKNGRRGRGVKRPDATRPQGSNAGPCQALGRRSHAWPTRQRGSERRYSVAASSEDLSMEYNARRASPSVSTSRRLLASPSTPKRLTEHVLHSPRLDRLHWSAAFRTTEPL